MASAPPRPASQRRSPPREQSTSSSSSPPQRRRSEACSTVSEDSQTILLNRHPSPTSSPPRSRRSSQRGVSSSRPSVHRANTEPRKCWICFQDETEDTPQSSEWRNPCPCALTAHESCLLDWIADMEAPNSRRRAGTSAQIRCPQCKSPIILKRPRSLIVEGVRMVEYAVGKLVIPGVIFVGGYVLYCGALMHGVHTIYTIFGPADGSAILSPIWHRALVDAADLRTSADALHYLRHELHRWRLNVGLAAVPPILILSRTTLADSVLPILPMLFFATSARGSGDDLLGLGHWPPSAALSFAVLPYLRGAYNAYYERVWGARERKWLKEIQPRSGTEGQDGNGGDAGGAAEDGENILEINVDVNILEQAVEWDDNPAPPPVPPPPQQQQQQGGGLGGPAHPLNAPPLDEADPAAAAAPPAAPQPRQGGIVLSAPRLADTILGALIFPTIAATMGELLNLGLPKTWVSLPSSRGRPTGLLQTRWGRSIVGGCTFVVLKDAVMLYVKWRMARDHRRRRVLDCEGVGRTGRG